MLFGVFEHGQHLLRRLVAPLARPQLTEGGGRRHAGRPAHVQTPPAHPFVVHEVDQRLQRVLAFYYLLMFAFGRSTNGGYIWCSLYLGTEELA